jgi:hypothetical protein
MTDETHDLGAASDGLGLYRSGVIANLVLTCIAIGAVGLALLMRDPAKLQGLGLVLPLAGLAATLMMVVGLVRYASNLPLPSGASGGAVGGVILMILGGLLQLYAYSIVWRLHSVQEEAARAHSMWDVPDLGDLMDKLELLPWIELMATVAGLLALLLVLGSLRALARWLGDLGLERRAASLSVAVGLLAVFAAGVRWYLASARRPSAGLIIVLGLGALIWALVAIIQYIGLLRETADLLDARRTAIPPARVQR